EMRADLVVDTGGRGSRALRWLRELGFEVPSETTLGVDFAYASTKLEIPDDYVRTERLCVFISPPPEGIRGALLGEIENDTWHLSVAGRFGEYPPADPDGLMAFVRSLPVSRLYDLVKGAERVAEIAQYRFPTSIQRRFHELSAFPENFLVLGDAICSFNPVYGQGMSSGALQARELRGLLAQRADGGADTRGLALEFFPRAADVILTPWSLAAAQDLAFPQTSGERPENQEEMGRYLAALGVLAARDPEVMRLLMEVFHLARHIRELAEEPLLSRVLAVQGELASAR
ncbi:MAG: FAD-binding monooxygenase, partial [Gammaproteobacteria bacterium]